MRNLEQRAVAIARADKRAMRVSKVMNSGQPFAFRLAALNAMGGERRVM